MDTILAYLISIVFNFVMFGIPTWRILGRVGFSRAWILLLIFSGPGFWIILGMLAFRRWPDVNTESPGLN